MNTDQSQTTIIANPQLPTIEIVREFAAPVDRVFRAWTDPQVLGQWLATGGTTLNVTNWDLRTGGSWRYVITSSEGQELAAFWGSVHELRSDERLVRTESLEGMGDGAVLETLTFEDLGSGRTRVTSLSLTDTIEGRDAILASGMEHGVVAGYAQLDALLAAS